MPNDNQLPHLLIEGRFTTERYISPPARGGGEYNLPVRDRARHGATLLQQLDQARAENEQRRGVAPADQPAKIILEVRSEPNFELALASLDSRKYGFELACFREENNQRIAVIHVAENKLISFVRLIDDYLHKDYLHPTAEPGTPSKPKNQRFVDPIAEIRLATLHSFWMDASNRFPARNDSIWWEVWLRAESDQGPWDTFRMLAQAAGMTLGNETIRFPDRLVGLCHGTAQQLSSTVEILDLLGEVRKAKANPAGFLGMTPREQAEQIETLLGRITPASADSPAVCILDGGIVLNPLLEPALGAGDCLKYDPSWPLTDQATHGTEMAGVALYGDALADHLAAGHPVTLQHRLESVKVLPPRPGQNEPRLYGAIIAQATYRIESQAPTRPRSLCMAITADGKDHGRPTSWSGEIDQLCAGVGDGNRRLFFISAGNTDVNQRHRYPASNDTDSVQDPAQAWNAITVGAYTQLSRFSEQHFSGYRPLAPPGDLAPSSTTSLSWNRDWPLKPDIVLEGGNFVIDQANQRVMDPDDMTLLTTAHATSGRLLVPFRDTSAATAQAARMAAILQSQYPLLWPETIRALLVHSAEWTDAMRSAFDGQRLTPKEKCHARLRRYGYGVPNLDRALYSARNSLTLIAQQTVQPFVKDGSSVKSQDMGLHRLPWPNRELLELGEEPVEMRITLSYFVEPKPGRSGGFARTRHRYQSHGLRFEVRRPTETHEQFRQRVNRAARSEDEEYAGAVG
ncbi:MAG TPA: S8 family peptidase, partial [Gemmataceae bacterium]|nr:S8 family peptidase [Gemmataceae bacterium]